MDPKIFDKITNIELHELKINDEFLLSNPIRIERFEFFNHYFSPVPGIIVNHFNEVVFGLDYYYGLLKKYPKKKCKLKVAKLNLEPKEALFINFNLSNQFFGLNLYEKLTFLKKILEFSNIKEIYKRTIGLNLKLNLKLIEKLNTLLSQKYKEILISEKIDLLIAMNISNYKLENQKTIIELFDKYHFSKSNQQKILEMLDELIFKYKCSVKSLFKDMGFSEFNPKNEKSSEVFERIFKYRFPNYSQEKLEFLKELSNYSIPPNISVTPYPLFEKKSIDLRIKLKDVDHLKMILEKIKGSQ